MYEGRQWLLQSSKNRAVINPRNARDKSASSGERERHETNGLRLRHDGDLGGRLCETDSQRGPGRALPCGTVYSGSGGF